MMNQNIPPVPGNRDATYIIPPTAPETVSINPAPEAAPKEAPVFQPGAAEGGRKNVSQGTAAGIAAAGVALGAGGVLLGGAALPAEAEAPETAAPKGGLHDLVDDQVPYATSVNDSMSFSQAFAAARAEVGAGGCFEWHGQLYGTYYKTEWDAMTPAQRHAYEDHFAWNHGGGSGASSGHSPSGNDTASHHHAGPKPETEPETEEKETAERHDDDDTVEPVPDDDINVMAVNVDGDDVYFIDVDGDDVFDYAAIDANGNEIIDEDEIIDISDAHVTVADVDSFSDFQNGAMAYDIEEPIVEVVHDPAYSDQALALYDDAETVDGLPAPDVVEAEIYNPDSFVADEEEGGDTFIIDPDGSDDTAGIYPDDEGCDLADGTIDADI